MAVKPAFQKTESGNVFGQRQRQPKMLRVGPYARVSTIDQQTLPMQSRPAGVCRPARLDDRYASPRGGLRGYQSMWCSSGRLDRWGRSVTDLLTTLQELEHLGVGFVSLTEALGLTTPTGPACCPCLLSSKGKYCGNELGPVWKTPGRTVRNSAGP